MSRLWRGAVPGQLSLLELLDELPDAADGRGRVDVDVDVGAAQQPGPVAAGLGEWERQVLAFAVEHHLSGRYDLIVQQYLNCSTTRYLQVLTGMLDRPEALAVAPDLVGRLRAPRDRRQRLRALSRGPGAERAVPVSAPAPGRTIGPG